ncbi:MAG TPA: class I SAM-dependent methyltransferase [Opitutaceae bacterium]|nr:class I SAM-dependent methyltransferase [Opitutaceae bacterium]
MTTTHERARALRDSYAGQGGSTAVFSPRVDDYLASRPGYPADLFAEILHRVPISDASVVADVGSGTGLLAAGFLERNVRVVAIEPSEEMRRVAEARWGKHERYRGMAGTAEQIPLPTASVALVTAAQAFHWFDLERAREEFLRVLVPEGQVALVWNDREMTDPTQQALETVFSEHGGPQRAALAAHDDRSGVPLFFGSKPWTQLSWNHEQVLDAPGVDALVFSRSYMPLRASAEAPAVRASIRRHLEPHMREGGLTLRYVTRLYLGRPGHSLC